MTWSVLLHPAFETEFQALATGVQDKLSEVIVALTQRGPHLGRPAVDTLEGSKHSNMKEIRLKADKQVWRFAFAFDPSVKPSSWSEGQKQGVSQTKFYKKLIATADSRFDDLL